MKLRGQHNRSNRLYERNKVCTKEWITNLKRKYPQLKKYNIENVLKDYHDHLINIIANTREGIELPKNCGCVFTGVFPSRDNKVLDYIQQRAGELYDQGNPNTFSIQNQDGFVSRTYVSTANSARFNRGSAWWGFHELPNFAKARRKGFISDWKKFVILPNGRYIKAVFKISKGIIMHKNLAKDAVKNGYNEFDFND